jgi:glycerate-2-kinase
VRTLLEDLYRAAVTAAAPGPALRRALAPHRPESKTSIFLFALGKAAHPMAAEAVAQLREWGLSPAGGVIVSPAAESPPHPALLSVPGDHPHPGPRSFAAAAAVAGVVAQVTPADEVWVLLSGGTTSLIGAPIDGVAPADLIQLYDLLLGSGLDIAAMNRIRKRFSRWGAGRLAAALTPARVKNFTISDVIGDDLAAIGSGPCVPDESSASDVRRTLASAGLWSRIPASVRDTLEAVLRGQTPETPKPEDPAFKNLYLEIVVSNRLALEAAARRAETLNLIPRILDTRLAGEAAPTGRRLAQLLVNYAESGGPQPGGPHKHAFCLIWGGETTVTLGPNPGLGGRNQELALAAAEVLGGSDAETALLSAGTDGRDGPTDAAGAVVDPATWRRIRAAGRNPAADLAGHNAFPALDSAGALLRAEATGTNVMDIVIGYRSPGRLEGPSLSAG